MQNKNKIKLIVSTYSFGLFLLVSTIKSESISQVQKLVIDDSPAAWLFNADRFYLEVRKPAEGINYVLSFKNSVVEEEDVWNYALCKKTKNQFVPERIGGRALTAICKAVHMLPSDYKYKGSPIVDEYLKNIPFRMTLNSQDLKTVIETLQSGLKDKNIITKPVLLLELNDTTITSENISQNSQLAKADAEFINSHFTLPKEEELINLRQFFGDSRVYLRNTISAVEGSSPEMKYKTINEYIYNDMMKKCKDFKYEKVVPALLEKFAIAFALYLGAKSLVKDQITKSTTIENENIKNMVAEFNEFKDAWKKSAGYVK